MLRQARHDIANTNCFDARFARAPYKISLEKIVRGDALVVFCIIHRSFGEEIIH